MNSSILMPSEQQPNPFQSFYMGGFECATHRRGDNLRVDVLSETRHDLHAAEDYKLLQQVGIRTVRDGLRWHLIEVADGVYDWSSFLPMLDASLAAGTQVIWDLCHWGLPDHVDVFAEDFPLRFAAYAKSAALVIQQRSPSVPLYCPINEISFWSWIAGDVGAFAPHQHGRGPELKRQLARATICAIQAIRSVDPRARFVQPEPLIHIAPGAERERDDTARYTAAQYEACDMLGGTLHPELGGSPEMLDILGVNYYWNNQWVHNAERAPLGHPHHRPLHELLADLYARYRRPILITETGAESKAGIGWLGYVATEVRQAQRYGVEILGVCLYPVMDYLGWDDERHCRCGLIEVSRDWRTRSLRHDLADELLLQNTLSTTRVSTVAPASLALADV